MKRKRRTYYHGTTAKSFGKILKDGLIKPPVHITTKIEIAKFFAEFHSSEWGSRPVVLKLDLHNFMIKRDPYFGLGMEKEFEDPREVIKFRGKLFVTNRAIPTSRILAIWR